MLMHHLITEHDARMFSRVAEADGSVTWLIKIITPGVGSSGTYTPEVLARDAATAFPAGTKLWFMHPEDGKGAGDRDPRDQWGVLKEDAHWSEELQAVVAPARILKHWQSVIESLGTQAELSIYAWAERNDEEVVTALLPHRTNSVDIVSYPGRPGSGLSTQIESLIQDARNWAPSKPAVEASAEEKEGSMKPEEIQALVESAAKSVAAAVVESIGPVLDFVNESKSAQGAEVQAKVDAEAIATANESAVAAYKAAVEKIDAAELLAPLAADLKTRAAKGEEITESEISAKKQESDALVEAAEKRMSEKKDGVTVGGVVTAGERVSATESAKGAW